MKKQVKQDMAELIVGIQQQLISLERKIDALMSRSPDRPSGGEGGGQHREMRQDRGPRDRERFLYKAVCADCNKECEVPFRPSQDRPVYCKKCFSSRKGGGSFHADRDNRPGEKVFVQERPFEKYRKRPDYKGAKGKKKRR